MSNKLLFRKYTTYVLQKFVSTGIFLEAFWTAPVWANNLNFDQIYIFGDSTSDQGNVFNVRGFPPEPFFYQGRFTNGKNWIDYLSRDLSLSPELYTSLNSVSSAVPKDGINFAFGGATTGETNVGNTNLQQEQLPGLQQQIDYFSDLFDGTSANPEALYTIWIGANDYIESLNNNGSIAPDIPITLVNNLSTAINELTNLGANNILIFNQPNVSIIPLTQSLTPETIEFIGNLTYQQNEILTQSVKQLNQANPELNLVYFNVDQFFQHILDNPDKFGFINVTDHCSGLDFPNLPQSPDNFSPCKNPDQYFFWDNQHPTSAVYKLLADEVLNTLESEFVDYPKIPEPSMVTALGLFSLCLLIKKNSKI